MSSSWEDVRNLADLLSNFPRPWFISGGWAIELLAPDSPRDHEDLEVGIFREDQFSLRAFLKDWKWRKATAVDEWIDWPADEFLELPAHQLHARRRGAKPRSFEVFLNEGSGNEWHSRRHSGLRLPLTDLVCRSIDGIPYLTPDVQLLYKAKYHRPKDEFDFAAAVPRMDAVQRKRLRKTLQRYHPRDSWIAAL